MTCDRCGSRTTRARLCRGCARLDDTTTPTTPTTDGGRPDCGQCGEPAPEGSYATQTPGLWLCADCHPEGGDGRQPMEVGR
jgi:hypothetical protein